MSKKRIAVFISLVIILSMLLAACQTEVVKTVIITQVVEKQGTPVVIEKSVTATPIPPTKAPPTAVPKAVDSVVIAMQQEPDTLHALLGATSAKSFVLNLYHLGCVGQNEKTEWVPLGCESVPSIENGGAKIVGEGDDKHLEVTYKIRKGWRWTDGTPVTVKDIIYWWKLSMDPEFESAAGRSLIEKIYDVSAVNDSTALVKWLSKKQINEAIKGTLKGNVPFATYKEDYLAIYGQSWNSYAVDPTFWFNINWLPEHILSKIPAKDQAASEYARKPLGEGPFVVKDWKAGQEIVLEKSSLPFPLGEPKLKTVTFRFFGDTAGVLAALKKGEVDSATGNVGGLTEAEGADLDALEATGRYKVSWIKGFDFEHIDLNVAHPPLDDPKVRQALALAIDRDSINKSIFNNKKAITDLPLPKGLSWAYPADSEISIYSYNLDKAKALLKEAGWDCSAKPCTKKGADGKTKTLEFTFMTTDRESRIKAAQIIMSNWAKLNVGVNVQFLYGRGLFSVCSAGGPLYCRTYDAAMYTFSTLDDATFYGQYACSAIPTKENNWSGQNTPGWCNQKAVDALNKSENDPEIALSQEKRKPHLNAFFKEFTKDVPVIMLYGSSEPFPYVTGWKNFKPGPTSSSLVTWNSWEWEVYK